MKKIFILSFLLIGGISSYAQKASDKALSESCDCVKKVDASLEETKQTEAALACLTASIEKYGAQLKKEFNITTADKDGGLREVGMKLGGSIAEKCPAFIPHFQNLVKQQQESQSQTPADINPDTLKVDNKICALFKSGKMAPVSTFINNRVVPNNDPTGYSEIKDGFIYDYEENKKYLTKWSVKWSGDCGWEQTLVESTSPNINAMIKKGQSLVIKGIGTTKANQLYISTVMMGTNVIVLYKKIK